MSNADARLAIGISRGLASLPERIRERRLENENRQLSLADRDRRISREDETLGRDRTRFDRQQTEWSQSDEERGFRLSDDAEGRENRRVDRSRELGLRDRDDAEHVEDRSHTQYTRGRQKVQDQRVDFEWSRSRDVAAKKMREEGMDRLLSSLRRGADPAMAEREFNTGGELQIVPGSLRYDPATGNVSFAGPGGNKFDGPIDQLEAIFSEPAAPMKLGANDRIVDPSTGKDIIPPSGGAGGGMTKWNRQVASNRAADVVRQGLGLKYDSELRTWQIPDGMSEKVSFGVSLAGQIAEQFESRLSAEESGYIAYSIAKTVPSQGEAEARAKERLNIPPGLKVMSPEQQRQVAALTEEIIRFAHIKAAQQLTVAIRDKESELGQRSQPWSGAQDGGQQQSPDMIAGPPPNLLREGVVTTFRNGQKWTLQGGQPVQVQ